MTLILFLIFILALILGKWVGIPFKWLLTKIVGNPYGAIIVTFLLILSFIRLFKLFVSETAMPPINFPGRRKSYTKSTKRKE